MAHVPGAGLPGTGEGEEYDLRSPDELLYNLESEKDAKIVAWRVRCFERAGMTDLDATILALRRNVDRVDVERALKGGASSSQVRDIFS